MSLPTDIRDLPDASGCPFRKLSQPGDWAPPEGEPTAAPEAIRWVPEHGGGRWLVRSFTAARQVLRSSEGVRQAGFGAEQVGRMGSRMRPPILYLEGAEHRAQRKAAARLFAPKVTEGYRGMMERLSTDLVGRLRADRSLDLSDLSLRMAVQVAAQVVGLTESSTEGLGRRLDTFFETAPQHRRFDPRRLSATLRRNSALLRFYHLDVKPAIRARRRGRTGPEDVIAQLVAAGFSDLDILTECVTYGAAGMVTTREFITVAVWHLLEDPALLARYRGAESQERVAILEETLRLEPVVGHLHRRTTAQLDLDVPGGSFRLPAGSLVDLDVRAVNAEAAIVGAEPLRLCPGRELPRAVPATMLSFGDGHHRCPGAPIAIMESEIFITELLRHDVVSEGPPTVVWNPVTLGYDLSGLRLRLRA